MASADTVDTGVFLNTQRSQRAATPASQLMSQERALRLVELSDSVDPWERPTHVQLTDAWAVLDPRPRFRPDQSAMKRKEVIHLFPEPAPATGWLPKLKKPRFSLRTG